MSASSGITVHPDLAAVFADALKSSTIRFLKVSISNGSFIVLSISLLFSCLFAESLVLDSRIDAAASFEDDLAILQNDDVITEDGPAYILAKMDPPSTDWTPFFFVPENAKVRDKVNYSLRRLTTIQVHGQNRCFMLHLVHPSLDLSAPPSSPIPSMPHRKQT